MITGVQPKLLVGFDEDGSMTLDKNQAEALGLFDSGMPKWRLVRERDGLTKQSEKVMWVEWNEDGTFKEKFDNVAIRRSLIMSPFSQFFAWQTTTVTEIVEQRDDYIKFKTQNSNYELFKL